MLNVHEIHADVYLIVRWQSTPRLLCNLNRNGAKMVPVEFVLPSARRRNFCFVSSLYYKMDDKTRRFQNPGIAKIGF